MTEFALRDLVLAHLFEVNGSETNWPRSTPGIARTLDFPTGAMAGRISLLSALSELKRDGLVEESVRAVDRLDERRKVYSLTDAGRERASSVLERAEAERITAVEGDVERSMSVETAAGRFRDGSTVSVLAALDGEGRLHLDEPTAGRFADREDATATLRNALDEVRDGTTRTVAIRGEEGIGKTALVEEFERDVDGTGVTVAMGGCSRTGAVAYGPFREVFEALGLGPADFSLLERSGDAPRMPDDWADLEARRQAAFHEVGRALARRAVGGPLVVFLDDLQWADRATLRLLEYLLGAVGDAPVLFVLAYRSEDVPDDHPIHGVVSSLDERIDLEPLDDAETTAMVQWLLGRRDVPDSFLDLVCEQTGGNPLFVVESVARARERGTLDPDHGVYPESASDLPVPDRVTETIDARLRGLDATARDVLTLGAVVGETVPMELLSAATDVPGPELLDYVDGLVASRLWTREGGSAVAFTSGVVRDVVRSRTDDADRRDRHRRVAETILDVYDSHENWYATVARHFRAAGDEERAMEFYRDAADRAIEMYAADLAVDHYESVLEIARDLGRTGTVLETLESIGEVTQLTGDYDDAERRFQYVRDRTDDSATERRMCVNLSRVALHRGDHDETVRYAEEGLATADESDPDETHCDLLSMNGWGHLQSSQFDEAIEAFERERELAEAVGTDTAVAQAAHDLGTVRLKRGEWDAAIPLLSDAVDRHERAGNDHQVTNSLNNLGVVYWQRGDLDSAADCFERALDAQEAIGDRRGVMTSTTNLGLLHQERGDVDGAAEKYKRALSTARELGDKRALVTLLANLASVAVNRLAFERAENAIDEAVDLADDIGNRTGLALSLGHRTRLALLRDDLESAMDAAQRRSDVAEEIDDAASTANARAFLGMVHLESGDLDRAIEAHERCVAIGEEHDNRKLVARGRLWLVRDYLATGDVDAAKGHLERARNRLGDDVRPSRRILATLLDGRILALEGDEAAAVDRLETGLADAESHGHRLFECRIRHRLAATLAARGDRDDAATVARQGLEDAENAGATLFVRRFEKVLDAVGNEDAPS